LGDFHSLSDFYSLGDFFQSLIYFFVPCCRVDF
jgi:hypothetical protein